MTRLIIVVAAILAWGAPPFAMAQPTENLPAAKSFEADSKLAAAKKIPILVLYTSPGCPFCQRAKSEYLVPMLKDPAYKNKVIMREVDITSQSPLTLYNGNTSTGAAFAAQHKVAIVPTIKVINAQDAEVAEPIVGLLIPDYYFGYIDSAITGGIQKMRAQ
jgi:thioredoxin-related protein